MPPPPRLGRKQASVFSRDEIGVEQLHSLKEKFAGGDLTEVEFVRLFRETIDSTLSETQLTDFGSDSANSNLGDDMSCRYITTQPDKVVDVADAGGGGGGDGSAVRPANNHKDIITRIVALDKPHLYVTASRDGSVRTWSSNTLAYQSTIATGRNWITDCSYMKRSNRLAVSSMNRTLAFYDMSTGQSLGELSEYSRKQCIPLCLEYVEKPSDEEEALVVGDDTGGITIIDVERMVAKFEYSKHKKGVFDLVWSSSSRLIASCGMERDISIWNPYSSQRAVATLRGHAASVLHLACDDDNFQIVSVSSDNVFKVWDIRNHRCLQTYTDRYKSTGGADNRISSLLFDPKAPGLISATTHLARWPLKMISSEEAELITKKAPCISCYNSVFNQVLTAEMSEEGVVKTWSAETGEEVCSFNNAHGTSPITAMSFDCAGRRLITGSHDGAQVKMWNFSNGALVKQFLKQENDVVESRVSPFSVPPPRPPRVRDIVVMPESFDAEKLVADGSSNPSLPSPTRTTLRTCDSVTAHPPRTSQRTSSHHQRYQQGEVTCILDIERNVRVGMGEYICQRFVCSVGWDRKIYIWLDSNDDDEPLPMWVIAASDTAKGHTDDILSVVYIPPATLATSGLDGKVWL
ncbi:hypothetical protein DYB36_000030 [Aphanomyces astaci]|uniref:Uncharacterized protein n=1 Tax=Aphanomyces astaci TaxID=112090 RepID=A0A397AP59_APHAT|nr:hypothetical protein DYB36_000030 [Aphanomyces astaci]